MNDNLPSVDFLHKILECDPETGRLTWLERTPSMFKTVRDCNAWNTRYSGKPAFTGVNDKGYNSGTIMNRRFLAHRVIWAICTGSWPVEMIDHVDGVRSNNALSNLRESSRSQNARNRSSARGSTSKYLGVSWNSFNKKWAANIRSDGDNRHIGYFKDEILAARAYDNEATKFFGEFASLNFEV